MHGCMAHMLHYIFPKCRLRRITFSIYQHKHKAISSLSRHHCTPRSSYGPSQSAAITGRKVRQLQFLLVVTTHQHWWNNKFPSYCHCYQWDNHEQDYPLYYQALRSVSIIRCAEYLVGLCRDCIENFRKEGGQRRQWSKEVCHSAPQLQPNGLESAVDS